MMEKIDRFLRTEINAGTTLAEATFHEFSLFDDRVLQEAVETCEAYAAGKADIRPWLVLMSEECGTGKTHLAAAIANHRARNPDLPQAKWMDCHQWLGSLGEGLRFGSHADKPLDIWMNTPCLIVDDLVSGKSCGKLPPAEFEESYWAEGLLYLVLYHRYAMKMETVITLLEPRDRLPCQMASLIFDDDSDLVTVVDMETVSYRTGRRHDRPDSGE